jgi:hypothetical protein
MFFHLSQAVLRKINSLGLKSEYETNPNFNILVKSLPALSFVPIPQVEVVFAQLVDEFPNSPECNEFIAYFSATYVMGVQIGNRARNPRFPPELWNHTEDALRCSPKTTNATEGFHNALQGKFSCKHPNVWKLFDGIRRDAALHRLTVANARVERVAAARHKYDRVAERLAQKVATFDQEDDKLAYLRFIAHIQVAR